MKKGNIFLTILGLIIIVGVGVIAYLLYTYIKEVQEVNTVKEVVKNFYEAIKNENADTLFSTVSGKLYMELSAQFENTPKNSFFKNLETEFPKNVRLEIIGTEKPHTPEEKATYGMLSRKVYHILIDEKNFVIYAKIAIVEKTEEVAKIKDIINVGRIDFRTSLVK